MIIFSRHAKRQMKWRDISESDVVSVIVEPLDETTSVKDRVNIWGHVPTGFLKVTISRQGRNIVVITAVKRSMK